MEKLLLRRTFRDLKTNLLRYLTLFLLIALAMSMVVSTVASAESSIKTVDQKAEAGHLEDGQFTMSAPLSSGQMEEIEEMGITLEPCFSIDIPMADDSTLRLMKNRRHINLPHLEEGRLAQADNEAAIERLYADAHNLAPGDTLSIAGNRYTITGIVTSPDYNQCLQHLSDMSSDGKLFGTALVTPAAYSILLSDAKAAGSQEYRYSYLLSKGASHDEVKEALRNKGLTAFLKAKDNPRIKASKDDAAINIKVGLMAGAMVFLLLAYVISVFVIHSIDRESTMIGALYALGVKKKELLFHYTGLPVTLCLLGGMMGTALGYSDWAVALMAETSRSYYSTPAIETFYSPYLLLYGLVLPPLVAFIVNGLLIRSRLSRTALSLLRKEQPSKKAGGTTLKHLGFVRIFQVRQSLREKRSAFAVLSGIFVSLLILMLGLNCYALCRNIQVQNVSDTKYAYLYQYKYPAETVPSGGHAAYIERLKKEVLGYSMEVTFIGIEKDNPFFPSITSNSPDEISVSTSAAQKYGLSVGDRVRFCDDLEEKEYDFVVKEIVSYSVGLSCFMDAGSMRARFDREEGYYNAVYASRSLDVDTDRLYSVSSKEDVKKRSEIFTEMMLPLMTMLTGGAALIFLIVLYQMMKVMTDRSALSISLMKIFGYGDREIRRLYLDGGFLLVAAGALALLPLAKALIDKVYPLFVANVACGIDLTWPPALYLAVYGGILLGYLLIRVALMRRLGKISPAEVLKDRE